MGRGRMKNKELKPEKIKVGEVIEEYEVVIKRTDLKPLKEELDYYRSIEKPDDREVLLLAKSGVIHPYYSIDRAEREESLTKIIEKAEDGSISN